MRPSGTGDLDDPIAEHLLIARQEVARVIAQGLPDALNRDRSELESVANEALGIALARGKKATRLAIRHKLDDCVKHERVRMAHDGGEVPERIADLRDSVVGEMVFDLAPRQVQAVRLVYYSGLTEAEAAGEMGCSQPVVHKILSAALVALRKKLQSAGY